MPIITDDIDLTTTAIAATAATAKFFSSKLTGTGKKVGLLNEALVPLNTTPNSASAAAENIDKKVSHTQNDITTTHLPFAPIMRSALLDGGDISLAVPHVDDRFQIDHTTAGLSVAFNMTPQSAILIESKSDLGPVRNFIVQYRLELFSFDANAVEPDRAAKTSNSYKVAQGQPSVVVAWDASPMQMAEDWIKETLLRAGVTATNLDQLEEWMRDYSIYERISQQAQAWTTDEVANEVCAYISDMPANPADNQLNALVKQLRYIENYMLPLESYAAIHAKITLAFPDDVVKTLVKQNLNLLMNFTLAELDQIRTQLAVPAVPATPVVMPAYLSLQQLACATTHEPLVMTQAGAGCGKSSTITERIDYLVACGVAPSDITVLSFTNAAADNITAKRPSVGSMTIARMINDIYRKNYPSHELSSIDTIVNSIDIFYPMDQFAQEFRKRLIELGKNGNSAYIAMNAFIENNFDKFIAMTNTIKQTSLELEIIVCYQRIDSMLEPTNVSSRHLIIDEVQDNSIFEFIYVLKYVAKHKESLFIVGDASQTLFEFRSANPRALNTLESSGVFKTFQLTTNYRSNQEILDFANVVLGDLDTNRFANIQLQANSLAVTTEQSFKDKVKLRFEPVRSVRNFAREDLPMLLKKVVIPDYVDDALTRGEQVAFLSYSRSEVASMKEMLELVYPNHTVASLVSDKVYATDIFSKYIKNFWNDVLQVPPAKAPFVVTQGIKDNLYKLSNNAGNPNVEKAVLAMISKWWLANNAAINEWVVLCNQRSLSYADFFNRLRDNLLAFEINHNAVRQSMTGEKNRERKEANAKNKSDLIVSTIHGAKGLEFDNVVVLHKEDGSKMKQAEKRLYYVAFTRAMKSMYVLSYGTIKNPPIESQYEQILNVLQARDKSAAEAAQKAAAAALGIPYVPPADDDADTTNAGGEPTPEDPSRTLTPVP